MLTYKAAYEHHFVKREDIDLPVGKVVCVGRNYAAHAKELGNQVPKTPFFFIKSPNTLVPLEQEIKLPALVLGACHFETEISVLIGTRLRQAKLEDVGSAIAGYGLALDLTLRDLQNDLKKQGLPWEAAKSFDGACPVSDFVAKEDCMSSEGFEFQAMLNGKMVQEGASTNMLFGISDLIARMSAVFTLEPGDIVLTGTPAGVGPLTTGDELEFVFQKRWRFMTRVS